MGDRSKKKEAWLLVYQDVWLRTVLNLNPNCIQQPNIIDVTFFNDQPDLNLTS
jgi:hypothetical protein